MSKKEIFDSRQILLEAVRAKRSVTCSDVRAAWKIGLPSSVLMEEAGIGQAVFDLQHGHITNLAGFPDEFKTGYHLEMANARRRQYTTGQSIEIGGR